MVVAGGFILVVFVKFTIMGSEWIAQFGSDFAQMQIAISNG